MASFPTGGLAITGVVIALLGGIAILIPAFTTVENKDVAKIGDLKLTTTQETSHIVPPFVGPTALMAGLVLVGAAFVIKR